MIPSHGKRQGRVREDQRRRLCPGGIGQNGLQHGGSPVNRGAPAAF